MHLYSSTPCNDVHKTQYRCCWICFTFYADVQNHQASKEKRKSLVDTIECIKTEAENDHAILQCCQQLGQSDDQGMSKKCDRVEGGVCGQQNIPTIKTKSRKNHMIVPEWKLYILKKSA